MPDRDGALLHPPLLRLLALGEHVGITARAQAAQWALDEIDRLRGEIALRRRIGDQMVAFTRGGGEGDWCAACDAFGDDDHAHYCPVGRWKSLSAPSEVTP